MARRNIILGNDRAFTSDKGAQYDYPQQQSAPSAPFGQQHFGAPQQGADYSAPQQGYAGPQGFGQPQGAPYGQQPAPSADQLGQMYAQPSATGYDTGRMTMRDALNATTATLGIVIVVGFFTAISPFLAGLVAGQAGISMAYTLTFAAMIVGLAGGFILGLVNTFKKQPSAALVLVYALFEGLLLGGLSGLLEYSYPGIAIQAVFATFAVAATLLVFFRLGILRTSPRLTRIVSIAMVAYMVFLLANLVVGLMTGQGFYSGTLGLIIGVIAVGLASYSLISDFEMIQQGVANGVPRPYAWRCAFAVTMTLVWMYIEIIRILQILRNN